MPSSLHSDERLEVSVIVPCFNTAQYLDQCLKSIEADDLASLEVIVLNDGSTDNSLEIMRHHERRIRAMEQRLTEALRNLAVHTLLSLSPMIILSPVCTQV